MPSAARLSTLVARACSHRAHAENAGHGIQLDAPDLTAAAFLQVIAAARAGAPLPACSATPLPRLGGTCLDPMSPWPHLAGEHEAAPGWSATQATFPDTRAGQRDLP